MIACTSDSAVTRPLCRSIRAIRPPLQPAMTPSPDTLSAVAYDVAGQTLADHRTSPLRASTSSTRPPGCPSATSSPIGSIANDSTVRQRSVPVCSLSATVVPPPATTTLSATAAPVIADASLGNVALHPGHAIATSSEHSARIIFFADSAGTIRVNRAP